MKYFYIIGSSNICYKRRGSFMLAQQRGITNLDILTEEHLFKVAECQSKWIRIIVKKLYFKDIIEKKKTSFHSSLSDIPSINF